MPESKQGQRQEEDVWAAIASLEHILEAVPADRPSLEALSHAYERIGDHTRAREYCIRLANAALSEGDTAAAAALLDRLRACAAEDGRAAALVEKIEAAATDRAGEAARTQAEKPATVDTGFNIADELSLAWNLLEAGELTQDEYAGIVQDLTEMSSADNAGSVSVLHVLETRAFKTLERILGFLSRACETPIVTPSSFELNADAARLLPADFVLHRCATIFEFVGKDALAIVLNPYSKQLREDVERLAGRDCHFFTALASEFDRLVQRQKELRGGNQKPPQRTPAA